MYEFAMPGLVQTIIRQPCSQKLGTHIYIVTRMKMNIHCHKNEDE